MTASATFSINGTTCPAEVSTTYGATVTLALISVTDVNSVTWSIVGTSGTSIASPTITPSGTPATAATFTVGADQSDGAGVAYGVRCRVKDAYGNNYDAYGVVGVPNAAGFVPGVAGEELWRHATHGYIEFINGIAAAGALSVRTFGAIGDGVTDDTTAIQAAIDAAANATSGELGAGRIVFPKGATCKVTNTLTMPEMACVIEGSGLGYAPAIVWGGAAGSPVIKVSDSYAVTFRDIWIAGLSTAKPSAIVDVFQEAAFVTATNGRIRFENVVLGAPKWYTAAGGDTGAADVGVLFSGTNGNNDEMTFSNVMIRDCDVGVSLPNSQSIWGSLRDVFIENAEVGIKTAANIQLVNLACANNDVDIQTLATARVEVLDHNTENAGLWWQLGESSRLHVIGGVVRDTGLRARLLTFASTGYTAAVAGDIGLPVVGGTTGDTGTLLAYDNTRYTWLVLGDDTGDEFDAAEAITITAGTGAGTTNAAASLVMAGGEPCERYSVNDNEYVQSLVLDGVQQTFSGSSRDAKIVLAPGGGGDIGTLVPFVVVRDCRGFSPASRIVADPVDGLDSRRVTIDGVTKTLSWPDTVAARFAAATPASAIDDATGTLAEALAVLRTSELIEWPVLPTAQSNAEAWYSAIELGATAGNPVDPWTDETGSGQDATGAADPTARGTGAGSYVEFNGAQHLDAGGAAGTWQFLHGAAWTVGLVVRKPSALALTVFLATWNGSTTRGTSVEIAAADGSLRVRSRYGATAATNSLVTAAGVVSVDTWHAILVHRQSNAVTIEVDGVVVASTHWPDAEDPAQDPGDSLSIGGLSTVDYASDIADVRMLSGTRTRHELDAINYDLARVRDGL